MSNAPSSFGRRWILYTLVAGVFAGGVWYFGIRKVAPTVSAGSPWRSNSMAPTPVRAVPTTKQDLADPIPTLNEDGDGGADDGKMPTMLVADLLAYDNDSDGAGGDDDVC